MTVKLCAKCREVIADPVLAPAEDSELCPVCAMTFDPGAEEAFREGLPANVLTDEERALVTEIRAVCARELHLEPDYPFFYSDVDDSVSESIDRMLVRVYRAEFAAWVERGRTPTTEEVALVLCHG